MIEDRIAIDERFRSSITSSSVGRRCRCRACSRPTMRAEWWFFFFAVLSVVSSFPVPSPPENVANVAFHVRWHMKSPVDPVRFLHSFYHKNNLYLFDLPEKESPKTLRIYFKKYPNVFVRNVDPFVPRGASEALFLLDGMQFFLDQEEERKSARLFDFYIPLTDKHLPLVPPESVRGVLANAASQNVTFLKLSPNSSRPKDLNRVHFDASLVFSRNRTALSSLMVGHYANPDSRYHSFPIATSEREMALGHDFAKFAVESMTAKRVLLMLSEAANVVEHFFSTLAALSPNVSFVIPSTSLHCPGQVNSKGKFSPAEILKSDGPCLFATVDPATASRQHVKASQQERRVMPDGSKSFDNLTLQTLSLLEQSVFREKQSKRNEVCYWPQSAIGQYSL